VWCAYFGWRYTILFYSLLLTLALAALVPVSLALWTVVALLVAVSARRFVLGARVVNREHLYDGPTK
jgi:hypothetical protein